MRPAENTQSQAYMLRRRPTRGSRRLRAALAAALLAGAATIGVGNAGAGLAHASSPTSPEIAAGVPADTLRLIPAAALGAEPVAVPGAPCGIADRLDYPVGTPDGNGFGVRWVFGRFSRRYGKIHAGEDWSARGRSSLGSPVHAIGHGQVSYAQPWGWGSDKGVIIIRHVFADGRQRYSLYGHLEPSTVTLAAGSCVVRGQKLGDIGKPRGSPHLHFEIRSHLPNEPGPGYWPSDPLAVGWEDPSHFIFETRLVSNPQVAWHASLEGESVRLVGEGNRGEVLVLVDGRLTALRHESGETAWSLPTEGVCDAALVGGATLMVRTCAGDLALFPMLESGPTPEPAKVLTEAGRAAHAALAAGDRVYTRSAGTVTAVASDGRRLWEIGGFPPIATWAATADGLALGMRGGRVALVAADGSRVTAVGGSGGTPVAAGDSLYLVSADAISVVDSRTRCSHRVATLEGGIGVPGLGAGAADGRFVATHRSRGGRVLVAASPQGSASVIGLPYEVGTRLPTPLVAADAAYLLLESGALVRVSPSNTEGEVLFDPGPGPERYRDPSALLTSNGLAIVDPGVGRLVAIRVGG